MLVAIDRHQSHLSCENCQFTEGVFCDAFCGGEQMAFNFPVESIDLDPEETEDDYEEDDVSEEDLTDDEEDQDFLYDEEEEYEYEEEEE